MKIVRLNQFDILKGIGIILVMFGHAISGSGFAHNLIYGFHMPLFFFCSGFFFKDKSLKESTIKDVKGLLIPWATFCCVLILCSFMLHFLSNGPGPRFQPLDENCYILYRTIWFLVCLFFVRLFYRLIAKLCNNMIVNILCLGWYFLSFALKCCNINIPFFIDSALAMLLFFHLGRVFHEQEWYKYQQPMWINIGLMIAYVLFVWLVAPLVNIKENQFPIYLLVLSIIPIWVLYQICCTINSPFLSYCGAVSLTIMGLHHPIYDVVMSPIFNRVAFPQSIEIVLMVVLTLIIVLIIDTLIMKYARYFLGKF